MGSSAARARLSYLPEVDGLRAIAVGTVFLFHLAPSILRGGFIGVDIFFVVSGFLITNQIVSLANEDRFTLLGFYQRRIARIAPAALLVIFGVLAAAALLYLRIDATRTGAHAIAAALSVINFVLFLAGNYFEAPPDSRPLLHYWSLAVEEQFYLFYPVFLWFLIRRSRRVLLWLGLLCAISFALSAVVTLLNQPAAYYLLPTRAWQLLVGAMLSIGREPLNHRLQRGKGALLAGGVMLSILSAIIVRPQSFPGIQALLPVAAAALAIAGSGSQSGVAGRLLASKPLLWVGRRSYVLYLWHWPVFSFVGYTLFDLGIWGMLPIKLGLSLVLTMATHNFIELPARRWLNEPRRQKIALVSFAVGVALVCIAGQALRQGIKEPAVRDLVSGGIEVNPNGHRWLVVVGDSTAMVMHPELMRRARGLDARVNFLSMSQVNELPGEPKSLWPKIDRFLGSRKPDVMLVAEAWSFKVQAMGDAKFDSALRELASRATTVIIVGEAPCPFAETLDRGRIAAGNSAPADPDPQAQALRSHAEAKLRATKLPNLHFIPIGDLLIASGKIRVRDEKGRFVYYDRRHLSDVGLDLIYPRVFANLEAALDRVHERSE